MKYSEVLEKLTERILGFHQTLVDAKAYKVEMTAQEFLRRTDTQVATTAQKIVDGQSDTWLEVLQLPHSLLYDLADVLHMVYWDTEDVAPDLFLALERLFSPSPFHFEWAFDVTQQRLHFRIDMHRWSVPCNSLNQEELWIGPFQFTQLDPNLYDYLQSRGWYFYVPTGFDQVAQFLLVSLSSVETLKRYLIPCFDPRESWFYKGIPDSDKPLNIWLL
jgi:hypothetical protein